MKCCGRTVWQLEAFRSARHDDIEGPPSYASVLGSDEERVVNVHLQYSIEEAERKARLWSKRKLLPSEVALHNCKNDCWLSWNGVVRDLTPLLGEYGPSEATDVILAEAGKDVSHWFDREGNLRGCISKMSGTKVPRLLRGAMPQTQVEFYPSGLHVIFPGKQWWKNDCYIVGELTSNTRQIAITNTLAVTTAYITVCEEDCLELILMRYLKFNCNASNYTWKYMGRILDMSKTLGENLVTDYAERFRKLGLPEDTYTPDLLLYYNDNI